jgi:hypothetical protein
VDGHPSSDLGDFVPRFDGYSNGNIMNRRLLGHVLLDETAN